MYIITSLLKSALVQRVSGVIGHKNITSTMAHNLYQQLRNFRSLASKDPQLNELRVALGCIQDKAQRSLESDELTIRTCGLKMRHVKPASDRCSGELSILTDNVGRMRDKM